jgi:hypothetical protein
MGSRRKFISYEIVHNTGFNSSQPSPLPLHTTRHTSLSTPLLFLMTSYTFPKKKTHMSIQQHSTSSSHITLLSHLYALQLGSM